MTLDNVAVLELGSDALAVAVLQVLLAPRLEDYEVGARVTAHAVAHALAQLLDVVPAGRLAQRWSAARAERALALEDLLREGERPCNVFRHAHFVDAQVRVRRDDRSAAEVHALACQT